MCAGVQNVSRPIERCQETSQCAPIVLDVTARATPHRYQGMPCPRAARDDKEDTYVVAMPFGRLLFSNNQAGMPRW